MKQEWINRIALTWACKTRLRTIRQAIDTYGSATEVMARYPDWVNQEAIAFANKELDFIKKHHIQTYFYTDDNYPYRLTQCVDAPLLLYAKGHVDVNPKHAVSIVGTRQPSERGKDWCRRLVLDLAAKVPDITIISGLAYGIDVAAHKAAIEAGIPTLVIPAHGLDRIYPSVHRQVAVQTLDTGGILTEYTTGTEPERHNFVARNRIVAGMADALVVVESKKKGGSLITADMAVDYGREVFAVPGRVGDIYSEGCNDLIKSHKAQLIDSADDLIDAMSWQTQAQQPKQTTMLELMYDLTENQQRLLNLLQEAEEGMHINQLVLETILPYNVVSSELIMLELQDIIKSMPGGVWRVKK
jgi:DNA processing protein